MATGRGSRGSKTGRTGTRIARIDMLRRVVRGLGGLGCPRLLPATEPPSAEQPLPPFTWQLPPGLPVPRVPADNPMTAAKIDLGRRLFYDTRLSGNGTFACASCHKQALAFTDGRARAIGSTGGVHARSAMSLANVAYNASFGWADPNLRSLEAQMAVPMFNEHPVELGLKGRETEVAARFASQAGGPDRLSRRVSR